MNEEFHCTIRKREQELRQVTHKKPYVNKINRRKRFKFDKEMFEKPVDFWKNVLWSDGLDGKVMIWRTALDENVGCFTHQTVGKLCVSWTDLTMEIFWNKICNHRSIILNSINDAFS